MQKKDPLKQAALIAFYTSLILLAVKFIAYFLTDSKAVLSDALESVINVVTGTFLLLSVSVSSLPADKNHPYGHGKIEAFSAGFEGGLIVLAAIMILVEAIPGFFLSELPRNMGPGIILVLGAGLVNLVVGYYLLHSGRKLKSEAVRADGQHLLADFYTSAGVVIGLLLVRYSGWYWLDPLVACLVAVNILLPGMRLARNSIKNLMNEAEPDLLARIVEALNDIKQPGWLYPHKLRAIRSGRHHHVDLHISLPHYWSLEQVHATEKQINETLLQAIGEDGDIMIHLDPCESAYCEACELESCDRRSQEFNGTAKWKLEEVTGPRQNNHQNKSSSEK